MFKIFFLFCFAIFFVSCSTHQQDNDFYQYQLSSQNCDKNFFAKELGELKKDNDTIFRGLNAGSIARDCKEFELSNKFFDLSEEAYKYDVDLQSTASKALKTATSTFINDTIFDYEGFYYERTMLNVTKGLNFMSLNDFANARVEFNRALIRQEKAKEYFAYYLEKNRKELEKAKKENENFKQNIEENSQLIEKQYENLFEDFKATEDFINPYVTYVSAVFFFLDKDYKKAYDLLKEVFVLHSKNAEMQKQFKVFNKYASSLKPKGLKKHIFVIYESGLASSFEEVSFSVPFIVNDNLVMASVAMPMLKKQAASFESLIAIKQNLKTQNLFDFDSIIASEFKTNLTFIVTKALLTTALKTSFNIAVAKNDKTGVLSLLSNLFSTLSTRADLRFWNFLPKNAQILMLENEGFIELVSNKYDLIYKENLDKNKDILILVRSFSKEIPARIYKIEN